MAALSTDRVPSEWAWMCFGAFAFGLANAISHGRWQPVAFLLLTGVLFVLSWRFVRVDVLAVAAGPRWMPWLVFGLLVALPIVALSDPKIVSDYVREAGLLRAIELGSIVLLLSYVPFFGRSEPESIKTLRFAAFLVLTVGVGMTVIALNPRPGIDVWAIQMRGVDVLLSGRNPYVWAHVEDTDPENDFVHPYNYPPATFYIGVFGVVLGKDVRYALLGAVVVAGIAMRIVARRGAKGTVPSIVEDAPALFFWLTPLLAMVLELGWNDPLQVLFVSVGFAAFAAGRPTLAAVVLGVAVSSKQSMFWIFPLVGFLLGFDRKRWITMGVSALLPVLPFLLWDFKALKYSNFDFMAGLPPRRDALCFTNAVWKWLHMAFPSGSAFGIAAAAVGYAIWRRPRSLASAGQALVTTYFLFFFFNRWAFANYYFLLTGLSALAGAAALHTKPTPEAASFRGPGFLVPSTSE